MNGPESISGPFRFKPVAIGAECLQVFCVVVVVVSVDVVHVQLAHVFGDEPAALTSKADVPTVGLRVVDTSAFRGTLFCAYCRAAFEYRAASLYIDWAACRACCAHVG